MTQVAIANEKAVRRLTENVVNYFGFLASNEARLSNVDIFMAIHNIHVHVLLNMEQQSGMTEENKLVFRKTAMDTFAQALENKPSLPVEEELMKLFAFRMMHYGPELLASLKEMLAVYQDIVNAMGNDEPYSLDELMGPAFRTYTEQATDLVEKIEGEEK